MPIRSTSRRFGLKPKILLLLVVVLSLTTILDVALAWYFTNRQNQQEAYEVLAHNLRYWEDDLQGLTQRWQSTAIDAMNSEHSTSELNALVALERELQRASANSRASVDLADRQANSKAASLSRLDLVLRAARISSILVYMNGVLSHYVSNSEAGMSITRADGRRAWIATAQDSAAIVRTDNWPLWQERSPPAPLSLFSPAVREPTVSVYFSEPDAVIVQTAIPFVALDGAAREEHSVLSANRMAVAPSLPNPSTDRAGALAERPAPVVVIFRKALDRQYLEQTRRKTGKLPAMFSPDGIHRLELDPFDVGPADLSALRASQTEPMPKMLERIGTIGGLSVYQEFFPWKLAGLPVMILGLASPRISTLQNIRQTVTAILLADGSILLLSIAVGTFWIRRFIDPIVTFTAEVKRIGNRSGLGTQASLDGEALVEELKPISVVALDEVGDLATAFNAMILELRRSLLDIIAMTREQREAQEALRSSEARLRRLIESSLIGVFFWDLSGGVLEANDAFLAIVGYDRDDLREGLVNWALLTPPQDADADRNARAQLLRSGRSLPYEKHYVRKDGSLVPVLVGGVLLTDSKDQGVTFVVDLTERKQAEADHQARLAAEAASTAKSEFLANMSHEIRTPMNAILGMSYLALQTNLNPQQHNYILKVHVSAELLLGIINDILDFSKIEAGKLDIEHVEFDLADVLDNLANVVGMKAEEKGLELLFAEPTDLPLALVGDPLRLSQVLMNLGNNAVKFTEHGEVTLAVEISRRGDHWVELRFEVRDTGIGIDEAQHERLFQPFEQADTSTSRRHGGTGLGLAISRQLVHLMGGELAMHSSPGRGSTFFFTLRLALQQAASRRAPLRHEGLLGSRALVVDDNAQARELIVGMVDAIGLRSDAAADGAQALRRIADADAEEAPYDIVLLDWKMPGMDGIDCARRIRDLARPGQRSPTVLMLTAFSRDEALKRVDEDGVQIAGLLTKPVTPSSLFDACCNALGLASLASTRAERRKVTRMEHQSRLKGARILLVEDNEINREVALDLLNGEGIVVVTANDGRQALEVLDKERFDAVLMDCQMPVLDGFAATRALRERPALRDLPVIAMTANAMIGDRERALAAGMNDHVAKPIKPGHLFDTLARWIHPAATASAAAPIVDETALRESGVEPGSALHSRLLAMIVERERGFGERFRAAAGDRVTAMRLAHDLKFEAATLGALRLSAVAAELEAACARGAPAEEVNALLDVVLAALAPFLQALQGNESGGSATS